MAELEVVSCTCRMDKKIKKRSYQKESRTKHELVELILSEYGGTCTWDGSDGDVLVGKFLMQYYETDWEFLKRVASMDRYAVIPEVCIPRADVYFGLSKSKKAVVLDTYIYNIHNWLEGELWQTEYVIYKRHEDILLGDPVLFMNKNLYVFCKNSWLENGLLYHDYVLRTIQGCKIDEIKNPYLIGAVVTGTVVDSEINMTRLSLDTDMTDEILDSMHRHAIYYTGEDRGFFGQPEVGDIQYLYFPNLNEKERCIIGGKISDFGKIIHMVKQIDKGLAQADKKTKKGTLQGFAHKYKFDCLSLKERNKSSVTEKSAPNYKIWGTCRQQSLALSLSGIYIGTGLEAFMSLSALGITFNGRKEISLKSKMVQVHGKSIHIQATRYINMKCGASKMAILPSVIHIKSADVDIKSLLYEPFSINLPPIEEMLRQIEDLKKQSLPIFASDGSIIQREGYKDIIDSEELYLYFIDNYYGKGDYANTMGQPIFTVYDSWLSDVYGRTNIQKVSDYFSSIDGFQLILDAVGMVLPPADLANCVIDICRGQWKNAAFDLVGTLPLIGDGIKVLGKICEGGKVLSGITYTYKTFDKINTANSIRRSLSVLDTVMRVNSVNHTVNYTIDGKKIIGQVLDTSKKLKRLDLLDNIYDGAKIEDRILEIEEIFDLNKNARYIYKGELVDSNLSIYTRIVDDSGNFVYDLSTIDYQPCSLKLGNDDTINTAIEILGPSTREKFNVVGHGNKFGIEFNGRNLNAKQVAYLIKCSPQYIQGQQIIYLYSCETGKLSDGFAQQLANELGAIVRAPNKKIRPTKNRDFIITDDLFNRGNWNWFFPK